MDLTPAGKGFLCLVVLAALCSCAGRKCPLALYDVLNSEKKEAKLKNWTIGKKLLVSFVGLALITVVVGVIGFRSLQDAANGFKSYREMARDANLAGQLQASILMVATHVKDFILTGDEASLDGYEKYNIKKDRYLETARQMIQDPERAAEINRIDKAFQGYVEGFQEVQSLQDERDQAVKNELNVLGPKMEEALTAIMRSAYSDNDAAAAYQAGLAMRNLLLARLYAVKFLDTNDQGAVNRTYQEFNKMKAELDELDQAIVNTQRRQLLNEVSEDTKAYEDTFTSIVQVIEKRNQLIADTLGPQEAAIASGIDEVKMDIKKDQDALGPKLQAANKQAKMMMGVTAVAALIISGLLAVFITLGITRQLQNIITGLKTGAEEVASASSQVSTSSQQLAEGSNQQASSIEETSSSLEEISSQIQQTAANADEADTAVKETAKTVETGVKSMQRMSSAITEIKDSANETSKIIKTIDDIAFQTNLLALNAAVEAARAGEAGKGFAVVAEEVRNLAQRSAEAAQNTSNLIEKSQESASNGVEVAEEVSEQLTTIQNSSMKVTTLISEIAAAAREQAQGIDQLNQAASEMDKVVQQNAADSEESASAAQELTSQAEELENMVATLTSMVGAASRNRRRITGSRGLSKETDKSSRPKSGIRMREHKQPADRRNGSSLNRAPVASSDQVIPLDDNELREF